jgi:hypothetical protein
VKKYLPFIIGALVSFSIIFSCQPTEQILDLASAEQLAKVHCASCHQYPEPYLLDKQAWNEHILPRMGYMMGVLPIDSIGPNFIEEDAIATAFQNPMLFRSTSPLSEKEWQAIRQFYTTNAPEQLPEVANNNLQSTSLFKVKIPETRFSPPSTTMAKFVGNQLMIGDANSKRLYQFDENLQLQTAANLGEGLVSLTQTPVSFLATVMGSFSPTDQSSGQIISLPLNPQDRVQVILDSLKRPVFSTYADLDGDNSVDIITCEFAKWTGSLSWWKSIGQGKFEKKVLRNMPGAIRAYVYDFNQDERQDIIALFGQGDEGIFIYYNQGNGEFKEERVLQFPPSYGSSYFNLYDLNNDGALDIVYTAGDAADFIAPVKPYQGIYTFLNDGNNQFKQDFFYPMPGAYAAIPADFDADGDFDIAAISFFPDYQNQGSSFLYLENQGNQNYIPSTIKDQHLGRWIVMDAADADNDGDVDLVLGSLAFEVVPANGLLEQWTNDGIPFVVLKNQRK